jgi:hypothetical protein
MRSQILGRATLALAACLPFAAVAGADEAPLMGVWQKHEYVLGYAGFTSHLSCDGVEGKVKRLLLAAGARDDLKVVGSCTDPLGSASRIAVARVTFHTLVPEQRAAAAPAAEAGATPDEAPERAAGAWKAVEFSEGTPSWLEFGDCELVEQFDRELLPFFATRNHHMRMSCLPNYYTLGAISVRFETFAPLPQARTGRPATPQ